MELKISIMCIVRLYKRTEDRWLQEITLEQTQKLELYKLRNSYYSACVMQYCCK